MSEELELIELIETTNVDTGRTYYNHLCYICMKDPLNLRIKNNPKRLWDPTLFQCNSKENACQDRMHFCYACKQPTCFKHNTHVKSSDSYEMYCEECRDKMVAFIEEEFK